MFFIKRTARLIKKSIADNESDEIFELYCEAVFITENIVLFIETIDAEGCKKTSKLKNI